MSLSAADRPRRIGDRPSNSGRWRRLWLALVASQSASA